VDGGGPPVREYAERGVLGVQKEIKEGVHVVPPKQLVGGETKGKFQ